MQLTYCYYTSFVCLICTSLFFFFNDTATTEIYTLSLHDALPISVREPELAIAGARGRPRNLTFNDPGAVLSGSGSARSEEHTSELQSQSNLVCRLLLEKKKKNLHTSDLYTDVMYVNTNCISYRIH